MTAPRLRWWWAMAVVILAGIVLFTVHRVQLAGYVVGAGVLLGAALRLVLPTARSGGLAVRSRSLDVLLMTIFGTALIVVTAVLDMTPRA
jgi:hypothetical protein